MDNLHIRIPNQIEMELVQSWFPERNELGLENVVDDAIILKDGEILGYGALKIWSEAMMALNPKSSNFTKSRIYKKLIDIAIKSCASNRLVRLHASPDNNEFNEILKKSGFIDASQPILALEIRS